MTSISEHSDSAEKSISAARDRVYSQAAELRDRIAEGTEDLGEAARDRVIAARLAAIDAQDAIEKHAAAAAEQAKKTASDHPIWVGLAAMAAGAALAAALPRTTVENKAFGSKRDALFDEADRIYQAEKAKLATTKVKPRSAA